MKPFRFRLQRVLRVRELREEVARAEFLAADGPAREAEELASACGGDLRAAELELRDDLASGPLAPAAVILEQGALQDLERRRLGARRRAATLRHAAERLRDPLRDAQKDRRALERLRERALEVHRVEVEKEDNRVLDEVAGTRWRSGRSGPPTDESSDSRRRPSA